jgi:uncharacterized membrane protein YeaQ/YmgE (transglycosylase-associated protein family)
MDWLYWIIIGFLAGALSAAVVGGRTARGCLPNIIVGIIGAFVGGWLAQKLGFEAGPGFLTALIVAIVGAIVVRLVLGLINPRDRT